MFRHKNKLLQSDKGKETKNKTKIDKEKKDKDLESDKSEKDSIDTKPAKEETVKDLLEKNLKWSQIIYEQNRRINHKLMWSAIAGWLRLILILAPLILAIFYLPPLIKDVWSKFGTLTSVIGNGGPNAQGGSLENLIKVFNLSPEQKEQIKTLLK